MKRIDLAKLIVLIALFVTLTNEAFAQTHYHTKSIDIKLNGTSNSHDWQMKSATGTSDASIVVKNGKVVSMSKMNFSEPVKNLKSGKDAMDKNTYKAMKTTAHPNIGFILTSAKVISTNGNNYQLNCIGNMTIAGITKQTDLLATGVYNPADKSFTITGVKKMKMTDYNVKPPKALLGTITTGDNISISYKLKYKV